MKILGQKLSKKIAPKKITIRDSDENQKLRIFGFFITKIGTGENLNRINILLKICFSQQKLKTSELTQQKKKMQILGDTRQ